MVWRARLNERGQINCYSDSDTGEVISAKEYQRRQQMQQGSYYSSAGSTPSMGNPGSSPTTEYYSPSDSGSANSAPTSTALVPPPPPIVQSGISPMPSNNGYQGNYNYSQNGALPPPVTSSTSPLIQPGAQILAPSVSAPQPGGLQNPPSNPQGQPSTANLAIQGKSLRLEGNSGHVGDSSALGYKPHGFLDATSIAILLPTLVLLALIIAAAHKKRLFPWQTIRTFNPPSGLMGLRDYERSFLCPPNLRRHGRLGKRNPNATWTDTDGVVIPFGFLARTHLPITIPMGRLPNKNMFIVAPSGSGKTTLMRAVMKALLAKPCVIIALEAKANDPNLDERKEGFKYSILPEAQHAGFDTVYFNPLDVEESIHWNPLDGSPIIFASSIVQDINSLDAEDQHWAERDLGYISGLAQLLKWGAVQVAGEDENGVASQVLPLPCNPRGLMRLVNNRRNIVESLRRLKNNSEVDAGELSELTQTLSSIIRTDTDWDKNIQGVRGRLRMFKNPNVLRVTENSNVDLKGSMHKPTVLIFGAPASLGPDAESLASCFVYQLQQALHTRYGTASVLPLFAFFDEYQTLNMDIAGRLSAIVRGANGGLTVILQNVSQVASNVRSTDPAQSGTSELRTIFSNAAVRVCLHNADESTARFFSEEIGKHAVVIPGVSDHYVNTGFGIFPTSWNRIHSQQVVQRVDPDAIKRMDKHHALVYLSPAGDPEFGETKPFMVDLRGIEEIARLHLLHNVSSRRTPRGTQVPQPGQPLPGGGVSPASPDTGSPVPPFGSGPAPVPSFAAAVAQPVSQMAPLSSSPTTSSNGAKERQCSACGQAIGNRKFCIYCGNFMGTPGTNGDKPQVSLETSAKILPPNGGHQLDSVPISNAPLHTATAQTAAEYLATALPAAASPAARADNPPFPFGAPTETDNQVIAKQPPAQPRRSLLSQGPLEIADAAQQAFSQPASENPKRSAVTSLIPDLTKYGLPPSPPSAIPEVESRPNTNIPQRPNIDRGVEF